MERLVTNSRQVLKIHIFAKFSKGVWFMILKYRGITVFHSLVVYFIYQIHMFTKINFPKTMSKKHPLHPKKIEQQSNNPNSITP